MTQVYFMRRADGTGPIKIGCSAYPKSRARQISSELRATYAIIASAPGDYIVERNLHLKFAEFRTEVEGCDRGTYKVAGSTEWFEPVAPVLEMVLSVIRTGDIILSDDECRERVFTARYMAGETLQDIAADYGISRERVRQVLRRADVPSLGFRREHRRKAAPLTADDIEAARLYAEGIAPKLLCERFGYSSVQLQNILTRQGVEKRGVGFWKTRPDDAELTAKIAHLYREGLGAPDIIKQVPELRFPETVYRYLKKAGVPVRTKRGRHGKRAAA